MSRCKSCNSIMSDEDMVRKFPDGTYNDLCGDCYEESMNILYDNYREPEHEPCDPSYSLSEVPESWT